VKLHIINGAQTDEEKKKQLRTIFHIQDENINYVAKCKFPNIFSTKPNTKEVEES